MVILKLPDFMVPRMNCIGDILPPYVSVDAEIVDEIKNYGIKAYILLDAVLGILTVHI